MNDLRNVNFSNLINQFLSWYSNDSHQEFEDYYDKQILKENLGSMTNVEFLEFFKQFAVDGGKIQSLGHRTAPNLIRSIEDNLDEFRAKILEPFEIDFNVDDWLNWSESFKYFGQGIATIYLNRVDRDKYVIVNDKSLTAFQNLGFSIKSNSLSSRYQSIQKAESSLLEVYPALKNYYVIDSFTHFLIGTEEGKAAFSNYRIEILRKNQNLANLISAYIANVRKNGLAGEVYKWELVNKFQRRPDPNKSNLYEEVKGIEFRNLIYKMGIAVLNHLTSDRPEEMRTCFRHLFDETVDLKERVKEYSKKTLEIYRELEPKLPHHQDERTIATLLTYHNPEKYTFYKNSFYTKYCELIGVKSARKGEKYVHYILLINDFIESHVSNNAELIELVESCIPEYYDGSNHLILAQDILYQNLDQSEETNYWIFQGNPDAFDFKTALKEDILRDWTVSSHRDKIKVGDKVIIWISGNNGGCYALAEITEEPHDVDNSPDDHLWKKEKATGLKAGLKITHNLVDQPILKDQIADSEELSELNVGHQGTNFKATKEEYETLLSMVQSMDNKKYWLYAPGENALMWEEFYNEGIMGLGWDGLGDLDQYKSKQEIVNKLQELENTTSSKKNDATANWEFKNEISIGDIIIVKKGQSELIGLGEVTSEYFYDDSKPTFKKCRSVKWIKNGSWKTNWSLPLKTLTDMTRYPSEDPNYQYYYQKLLGLMNNDHRDKSIAEIPKNLILYGPPGTGKTYSTIKKAVQIANPNFHLGQEWRIIKKEFERLVDNKQIVFTTFHQSMNYEDFVEGIKPQEPKEDGKSISYKVEDGIFKLICKAANPIHGNFEEVIEAFKKDISESDGKSPLTITAKGTTFDVIFRDTLVFYVQPHASVKEKPWYAVNIANIEKAFTSGNFDGVYNPTYVREIISYLEKNKGLRKGEKVSDTNENYVLIIDEINRGNVSAIFGELITLLEANKRLGEDESIAVTLPYSKEEFGVPSNLFIIGTMNTADRSVEALDTALRRRFSFEELMPDAELLSGVSIDGTDISLKELLKTINSRIEVLVDRDHTIGHSYFLTVKSINELRITFADKIAPLLQEYFYGDYGKMEMVIGKAFFSSNNNKVSFASNNYDGEDQFRDITTYHLKRIKEMDDSDFIQAIYQLINPEKFSEN